MQLPAASLTSVFLFSSQFVLRLRTAALFFIINLLIWPPKWWHHHSVANNSLSPSRRLDEEPARVSVAAWHLTSPTSLLARNVRIRQQKSRLFTLFLSQLRVSQVEPRESWESYSVVTTECLGHLWTVLDFTVLQPQKSCKHKPRCGISFKGIGVRAELPELGGQYVIFTLLQEKKRQLQPFVISPSLHCRGRSKFGIKRDDEASASLVWPKLWGNHSRRIKSWPELKEDHQKKVVGRQ